MKNTIPVTIMLLFAFSALSLGMAFAEENETAVNETTANETIGNETLVNTSLENATLINETLANATINNETLNNLTELENETNPFANVKGRQVKPK